jgi:pimeloyl-ACP methyl ester carboxylesterase
MLAVTYETLLEGRSLRMARLGAGQAVVLLHGYPDNLQIWCELAPLLATHHEVIAFDWPGMGYSDPWPGGATPAHMADRLLTLFDFWRIDRAALVGMDMGGQPALAFAAHHPQRVSRLVVMNSLVFSDERTSWEIRVLRRFGFNRFILRRLPRLVFRRAEVTFLPRGVRLPAALRADLWESFRTDRVRAFITKMCAGYQGMLERLPELYGQIACPTLVLWGRCDKHFPPVQATRLHAAITNSVLHIIAEGEHWMAWNRAEELAERLNEFLG